MKKIEFDEGYRNYQIGNDESRVIKIRLDPSLLERINTTESKIEEIEDRLKNSTPEKLSELSDEIKALFNETFDTDISGPAFGEANIFTPVRNGKMLFQSFFEAFIPVLEADINAIEFKSSEPRPEVAKYLKKETPKNPIPDISEWTAEEKKALLEKLIS